VFGGGGAAAVASVAAFVANIIVATVA